MTCDIHTHIEINTGGQWEEVKTSYHLANTEKTLAGKLDFGHDYALFAMLADVRNHGDIEPLSKPRGLPENISDSVRLAYLTDDQDFEPHSKSYATLQELKDYYDKHRILKHAGYVDKSGLKRIDNGESPQFWITETNSDKFIYQEWTTPNDSMQFLVKYLDALISQFVLAFDFKGDKDFPDIQFENANRVCRIVFWFDN